MVREVQVLRSLTIGNTVQMGELWNIYPGQTGSGLILPPLTQTTMYRRYTVARAGGLNCYSGPTIAVTITVQTIPTAGVIAGDQTICNGSAPLTLNSVVPGTGTLGATISYEWWESTDGGSNWILIPAANSTSFAPGNLTLTTLFRRITVATLNSVPCLSAPSASITITVQNVVQSGAIAGDQTVCLNGDPSSITSTAPGSGSGEITYRWESFTGPGPWTSISGANGPTYDPPGPIASTIQYRRITVSMQNSTPCVSAPTNVITVTVNIIEPGVVGIDQAICYEGDPAAFTVIAASSGIGTYSYQWQSSITDCNTSFGDIAGATSATYDPPSGLGQTTFYRRLVTYTDGASSCAASSNCITMTVRPPIIASTIGFDQIVCIGANPDNLTGVPASGGSNNFTYQWQWSADGTTNWQNTGATNPNIYTPPAQSRYYRLFATDVCRN